MTVHVVQFTILMLRHDQNMETHVSQLSISWACIPPVQNSNRGSTEFRRAHRETDLTALFRGHRSSPDTSWLR